MLKLAAIVGPTAVGKTRISIKLAEQLNGEIISCDSMQLYKGMDIGTAKAPASELKLIKHHLIDIIYPQESFSVAHYQAKAQDIIKELNQENKLPILVGGTGLYYQAVVDSYNFIPIETHETFRKKWEELSVSNGLENLYTKLKDVDMAYAEMISPNDKKRIIRALEVYDITGKPFSEFQQKNPGKYKLATVGLYLDREFLNKYIDHRVDQMVDEGLIDEVFELQKKGYDHSFNSMQALGYKQVLYYFDGMITKDDLLKEIKRETRKYAKRQYTWFKKDNRIKWFNINEFVNEEELQKKISEYMEGQLYNV